MGLAANGSARRGRDDRPGAGGWPTRWARRSSATSRGASTPERFPGTASRSRGELWAMMLDPKRTFDELIERLAPDDHDARRDPREPHLPRAVGRGRRLAGVHGGRQALRPATAPALRRHRAGHPASRNALDFLDAPDRLTGFLEDGRCRLFLAPTGLAARVVGRGTGVVFGVLRRVTGVDLLDDLSVFFRALGGLLDGFRERAERRQAPAGRPRPRRSSSSLARARAGRGGDLLPRQAARGQDALRRADREPRAPSAPGERLRTRPASPPSSRRAGRQARVEGRRTYGEAAARARDAAASDGSARRSASRTRCRAGPRGRRPRRRPVSSRARHLFA